MSFRDPKGQKEISCGLSCVLVTARLETLRSPWSLPKQTWPNGKSGPNQRVMSQRWSIFCRQARLCWTRGYDGCVAGNSPLYRMILLIIGVASHHSPGYGAGDFPAYSEVPAKSLVVDGLSWPWANVWFLEANGWFLAIVHFSVRSFWK